METNLDVIVVGAGLAGLAAARLAQRGGARVVVLDAHERGGRATSDRRDGFVLNRGPHALYLGGPGERVLAGLGLRPAGRFHPPGSGFGLAGGHVAPLPEGARALLTSRLVGLRGKAALARLLGRLDRIDASRLAGIDVRRWSGELGLPRDAADLVDLLVRIATYTNAPDVLSAEVAVRQLRQALRHGVRYLDGGWQVLVEGLANGLDVRRAEVAHVAGDASGSEVTTVEGTTFVAATTIVAAGTPAVAARVLGREPFDVGPPARAACLDLGTTRPTTPPTLFGIDRPLYLSTHCPPAGLAPAGKAVVHVARYLAPSDDASPEVQRDELVRHAATAGVRPQDIVTERYLHRMVVVSAVATAAGGGLRGRPAVTASGTPSVLLAGDWVGPVGHLADASLASASFAARLARSRVRT